MCKGQGKVGPTKQFIEAIDDFKPMSTTYREVGSVEGSLEIASVHGADHIKVWDRRFGTPVDCMVSPRQFNEALGYLSKRSNVAVRGLIHFANRRPDRIENVFDIRELPGASGRVSIDSIRPVDLTGGAEPADYLRGDDD